MIHLLIASELVDGKLDVWSIVDAWGGRTDRFFVGRIIGRRSDSRPKRLPADGVDGMGCSQLSCQGRGG